MPPFEPSLDAPREGSRSNPAIAPEPPPDSASPPEPPGPEAENAAPSSEEPAENPSPGPRESSPVAETPAEHIPAEDDSPPPISPRTSSKPPPPLLASQALIEDLAPVEPLGQRARVLCIVVGVLFAGLGALMHLSVERGHSALIPSIVVGAVTLFAAVARVTYRQRAVAMVALGAIVAVLGVAGTGPAQGTAQAGALWSVARFVGATTLPAALLFRARYRAFTGARLLLGFAFLVSLPYAFHAIGLVAQHNTFGVAQLGAVLALTLLAAGLPGFMGSETTAAGTFVAPAMIGAFALQAGLERLGALVPGALADTLGLVESIAEDGDPLAAATPTVQFTISAIRDGAITAVAFAASVFLSALGVFQILAWKFAPEARLIDVRRPKAADHMDDRPSYEDWSARS
ncbi:MAG: hypothetical protein IPK82_33010 [Polyangiaceae bacterium]|nr:hypothetical protein [Polyangiaceae bacterium]